MAQEPVRNKRIGIAMPHASRAIEYPGTQNSLRVAMNYARNRGYDFLISDPASASVATNRNVATNNLLKEGANWIFSADDDMLFPEDIFIKLIEANKDIVSGLYVGRSAPYTIMAFKLNDKSQWTHSTGYRVLRHGEFKRGDLIEVDGVGGGCVLFKRKVFETIPFPWYSMPQGVYTPILAWLHHQLSLGMPTLKIPRELLPNLSKVDSNVWDGGVMGEDLFFSKIATTFGFNIYLDTSVECAHIGDYKHTLDDNIAYEKIMEMRKNERTEHTEASPTVAKSPANTG